MEQLKKILKLNYNESVFHTHVSLITPKGKFQFNRQALEEFWDCYCTVIHSDDNPIIGVAEKSQTYLPVLVDVDLKIKDENDEEIKEGLYSNEQLQTVVQVYQSTLRQIVNECEDRDLTCVVLEKKMYQQTRNDVVYFKHGFHLHFPFLFLSKSDQEVQLIPRVQQAIKNLKLFENLGIEDSGSVIDKVCCKVPWLLYGSRKSESHEPYKVTRIYNSSLEELTLEKAFKNYQIFDHKERTINTRDKIQFYLPRILSIIPYNRPVKELKRGLVSIAKENLRKERKESTSDNHRAVGVDEALNEARKLLPLIASHRADDYSDWMTIGWCLYNISNGEPEGLDLWCDFSSRSEDKYDEANCIYQWERMTKRDLTLGTLKYYAKKDNPEEYKKLKEEHVEKHIAESLSGSHNDIARALQAEYGDEFVCASVSNRIWFQFVNHKWEQIEEGTFLREKISDQIAGKYNLYIKKLYDDLRACQDGNKSQESLINNQIKQVHKMITNVKSAPFKNNIMRECVEVFYDPRFRDRLDADPFLIGFKNGVYDLRNNMFRPGRPEDFLSKNMPINYDVSLYEEDEKVQDVYTFLEQVFPDKSLRKYFLDVSSDIFVGGNHEKTVVFWTGEGDNGKSVTQNFFELMLGKLAVKLNTNVVTGKKPGAGAAFADLARTGGGVRWVVMEEPDSDEMINTGIFKHLSGNDTFYARDLFEKGKDGREIKPMFKLVFICNKLPRIKAADKAVWNRVRVIPFEATFCRPDDPAPDTYEEQLAQKRFPMDKQFSKKIPTLVEAFAWVLIQHRLKIMNSPRVEPEKVRAATEVYRRQNDIYRQFIDDNIMEDDKAIMTLAELYNLFKDWFKEGFNNQTVPNKTDVEEYFSKLWGMPEPGKKWKGYRQKLMDDFIAAGDAIVLDDSDLVDYEKKE
jgi:P4 family phage/plasmid primase-like protien